MTSSPTEKDSPVPAPIRTIQLHSSPLENERILRSSHQQADSDSVNVMPGVSLFGGAAHLRSTPQKGHPTQGPSQNSLDRYISEGRKKITDANGYISDKLTSYNQVLVDE